MTPEEKAKEDISKKIAEAYKLVREAEALATTHKLSFSWDLAYGMGGTFHGDPEDRYDRYGENEAEAGWSASSQGC